MRAADQKGAPPPELQLALFCGDYHLPESGGMLEQEYRLMRRMIYLGNVYRTVRKFRSLMGDAINTELNQAERALLGELNEMGALSGGTIG